MTARIFAQLVKTTAQEILAEAEKEGPSHNDLVRTVIDGNLGRINHAWAFPQDQRQERTIRIDTDDFTRTAGILATHPEVRLVAKRLSDFTA